jgi:hypothetical protein
LTGARTRICPVWPQYAYKVGCRALACGDSALLFHYRRSRAQNVGYVCTTFRIALSITLPGGQNEITLKSDQFGAAIILYCKKARIHLPKNGTKLLSLAEDGVSMGIKLG